MRTGVESRRGFIKRIFVFLIITSLAFVYIAPGTNGDIGVSNDPPSWVDIFVDDHNGMIMVHVSLKDLNGWNDIYNVTLVVLDGHGDEICNITYKQYNSLDSTIAVIDWVENVGSYWNEDESYYEPVDIAPWNPDNAIDSVGLNVTFALYPFSGEVIKIDAYDMREARCGYQGPFSADYEIAPVWDGEDVVIPIGISAICALIGALFIVMKRMKSNKMARLIERGGK